MCGGFSRRGAILQAQDHDADLFVADLAAEQLEDGLQTLGADLPSRPGDSVDRVGVDPGDGSVLFSCRMKSAR